METKISGRCLKGCLLFFIFLIPFFVTGFGMGQKYGERKKDEVQNVPLPLNNTRRVREIALKIPGVKEEYTFLFLTDCHVVAQDGFASEEEQNYAKERYAMFQDGDGVFAAEQFAGWITYANEQQVDAVLLGGDILDFPSQGNFHFLQEQLSRLHMPYAYALGNHDWTYPWEYMTEKGKMEYLPLFSDYMEGNTAFHKVDFGELTVAVVDDSAGQVHEKAISDFEQMLLEGKPVIVLTHVPFLTQSVLTKAREVWDGGVVIGGGNYGGLYPDGNSQRFIELTTAKDSPVAAVLAGHVHFYDKDMIEGEKDVVQIVGEAGYLGSGILIKITGEKG